MRTAGIIAAAALVIVTGCKRNVVVKSSLAPDAAACADKAGVVVPCDAN